MFLSSVVTLGSRGVRLGPSHFSTICDEVN